MTKNTQRVASFEEACALTGKPEIIDLSAFPEELREYMYAQYKMCVIAEALNGEWKADWNNEDQNKYVPWFYNKASSGFVFHDALYCYSIAYAGDASRLCFKDSETAEYAGKQFLDIWKVIIQG